MPYVYDEGVVPVPAGRCTVCAGALEEASPGGEVAGWFAPSRLDTTIWNFSARKAEPDGDPERTLACSACARVFRVYPTA